MTEAQEERTESSLVDRQPLEEGSKEEQGRVAIAAGDENTRLKTSEESDSSNCACKCARRCCLCFTIFILLVVAGGITGFYFVFLKEQDTPTPVASCGDCHCITGANQTCPAEKPVLEYSSELIETLASQVPLNAYDLQCRSSPYCDECIPYDGICETTPPQDPELVSLREDAVCGLHYEQDFSNSSNCRGAEYHMQTYPSWNEADAAGAFVTHSGPCGACSTTQDLAAYLRSPDLTSEGKKCSKRGILSYDLGIQCYRDLGFTEACAAIWTYNGLNTGEKCIGRCFDKASQPSNGPPPECKLNDCLQCDEDESGPIFKQFAGRTRRRSGQLSAIARPCEAIVLIIQQACPTTKPLIQ